MRRNNKITRNRKIKSSQQTRSESATEHFMSGLNSKESRRKLRRYTFQAHITLPESPIVDEKGEPTKETSPARDVVLRLDRILFGDSKTALVVCKEQEQSMRDNVPHLKESKIVVEALPHETVTEETYRTIMGYQSMAQIYDRMATNQVRESLLRLSPTVTEEEVDKRVEELYRTVAETIMAERKAARQEADDEAFKAMAKEQESEQESNQPRMKVGIEAVEEALRGPSISGERTDSEAAVSG